MRCIRLVAAFGAVCSTLAVGQPLVTGPVVLLLGPPSSGKTLQAAALAKHLKIPIVAVSDLIRDNAAELQKARTRGITGMEPETDPLLNKFFEARLQNGDLAGGMILDGYPNTKDHADFATKLVETGVMSKPVIVHLLVPDDVVRKRAKGKDGKIPDAVEQRLKDYHRETMALKIYFPSAEIIDIDGTKKPNTVTKNIQKALKARFDKKPGAPAK
jgi:adenylate kinase